MASVPTVRVSEQDSEPESRKERPEVRGGSLLSVPSPVRSNIGINNPASGGLFPLPNSQQVAGGSATGNPRNKVALRPGFSLMDWVRLTKSGKDLSGVGGPLVNGKPREVTRQELRKHKKRKDAWMALNGLVFNVTEYMDYHPGGWDELVKGAGRDATDMFNEIHKWVNYQSMLEACLVGKLVDGPSVETKAAPALLPPPTPGAEDTQRDDTSCIQKLSDLFAGFCSVLPPIPTRPPAPTMDFFQTDSKLTVNIYTKRKGLKKQNVIIVNNQDSLRVTVLLPRDEIFMLNLKLASQIEMSNVLRIGETSGKIEIDLKKSSPGRWPSLGTPLEKHLWFGPRKEDSEEYLEWEVRSTRAVTGTTRHLVLSPPPGVNLRVGVGQHVMFRNTVEGMQVTRSYTPVVPLVKDKEEEKEKEGCLEFLIKIYPDGMLTPLIGDLIADGQTVSVSYPQGDFQLSCVPSSGQVILLAAGTGITPMLGILSSLSLMQHRPAVKLLTWDRTEQEIIWGKELKEFQALHSQWFSLLQVLTQPGQHWQGGRGRITASILRDHLQPPAGAKPGSRWVAVCGPPGFNREAVRILKEDFAFIAEEMHVFEG